MRLTAERLIGLFPRRWRERYGDEFVATVGAGPLHAQQVIDIVSGAIDAWLSADVRHAAAIGTDAKGGRSMWTTMLRCDRRAMRFSRRDAFIGAAVTVGSALVFGLLLIASRRMDWPVPRGVLIQLGFPGSLVLSMPFTYLKGQPWKAQVAVVGGLLAVLAALGWLATPS